jgi:hypothetical protein
MKDLNEELATKFINLMNHIKLEILNLESQIQEKESEERNSVFAFEKRYQNDIIALLKMKLKTLNDLETYVCTHK